MSSSPWAWIGVAVALFVGSACGGGSSNHDSDKESDETTIPELVVSGTREDPVPVGKIADIGGGWRLQVLDVIPDAAALMAAPGDDYYQPPGDGFTFMLVKVALGYFGTEDPKSGLDLDAFGTSSVALDNFCLSSYPDYLGLSAEMFSGGVAIGDLCFVAPLAEVDTFQLFGKGDPLADEGVYLELVAPRSPVQPMAALAGPQPGAASTDARLNAVPLGTTVAVGADWQLTINGAAHDITAAVMARSSSNEPPPEGSQFVGMEMTFLYNGAGEGAPSQLTIGSVGSSNVEGGWFCGTTPAEQDIFTRLHAGDSKSFVYCFVVPDEDVDGLRVFARADENAAYVWFATS